MSEPLGNLLYGARRRLRPDVWPISGRRIRRGELWVRQEDVDAETGDSPGTYTHMERGRLREPSDRYLLAVAQALRLTPEEWIYLWLYCRGYRPPVSLRPMRAEDISEALQAAVHGQREPCYVSLPDWSPVVSNAAARRLLGPDGMPSNILGRILLDASVRWTMPDWEERWVPVALSHLKVARIEQPQAAVLQRIESGVQAHPYLSRVYRGNLSPALHPGSSRALHIHGKCADPERSGRLGVVNANVCEAPSSLGAKLVTLIWEPLPPEVDPLDRATWPTY